MRASYSITGLATLAAGALVLAGCTASPDTAQKATETAAPSVDTATKSAVSESQHPQPVHAGLTYEETGQLVAFLDGQTGSQEVAVFTPAKEVVTVRVRCSGTGQMQVWVVSTHGFSSSSEWECQDHELRDHYDMGFQAEPGDEITVVVEGETGLYWAAAIIERTPEEADIPELSEQTTIEEESEIGFNELLEQLGLTQEEFEAKLDGTEFPGEN